MSGVPSVRIESAEAFSRVFSVSRETLERLRVYADLLRTWQRTINLVAPSTLGDIWHRHFADSAQALRFAPARAETWVDIGSGAGFPGLVLAILLAQEGRARVTLVESDTRKAAFLGEVARKVSVPVEIRAERIEKFATHAKSQTIDVITARALAPLPKLLGLVAPFFGPQTVALFLKGRDAAVEVSEARQNFAFDCTLEPSLTDPEASLAVIRNLHM